MEVREKYDYQFFIWFWTETHFSFIHVWLQAVEFPVCYLLTWKYSNNLFAHKIWYTHVLSATNGSKWKICLLIKNILCWKWFVPFYRFQVENTGVFSVFRAQQKFFFSRQSFYSFNKFMNFQQFKQFK